MKQIIHISKPHVMAMRIMAFLLYMAAYGMALAQEPSAPKFKVAAFTVLPNDISAYIAPVRDLNDEACALVKVVAPSAFVFSSPLGIVKRKEQTGEIWLYLPKGTKTLTLKHARWGVLRDYRFPKPLESRMTYELRVDVPLETTVTAVDTIVFTKTVRDTVVVNMPRKHYPLVSHMLLTSAFHAGGPSFGVMMTLMRRHGMYAHGSWNMKSVGETEVVCDEQGNVPDNATQPYYTGKTRRSNWTVTAGAIHRMGTRLCVFEGLGYGKVSTAWQLGASQGGGYALNDGLSCKGVAVEAGILAQFGRICVSASAVTIAGKQWQGCVGVGFKIGKDE